MEEFPAEQRVGLATTLLQPDSGHGRVGSLDIVRDAVALRSAIGLVGQYAAVDEKLTGRENLQLVGQLYRPGRAERRQRAERVLEQFQLADAADRSVRDLARRHAAAAGPGRQPAGPASAHPGRADHRPGSALAVDLWQYIEDRVAVCPTILLTTQHWRKPTGSPTGSEAPA